MPNIDAFLVKYRNAAEKVARELNIPVERILAQAGHETGWNVNAPGNNFFGIKAQPGYGGKSQTLDTTEDYGGGLQKVKQPFRMYDSPEDSFRDWGNLIKAGYQGALDPNLSDAGYATALKAGGYATDPNYAPKLASVIATTRQRLGQPEGVTVLATPPPQAINGVGPGGTGILAATPAPPNPDADIDAQIAAWSKYGAQAGKPMDWTKTAGYAAQLGQGLLAAGAPQQSWTPSPMTSLAAHRGDPQAIGMLPDFLRRRGLLG